MQRSRGFSLPEGLIALGVLAIIGSVAMPWFSALMQSYRLNAALFQLAGDLRYAQSLAVSNRSYYRFHWGNDVSQPNSYRIEKSGNGTSWPAASATAGSDPNVINNWLNVGASFPGMSLSAIKDANNTTLTGVIFNSQGSSVNAALPGFTSPVTLSLSATGMPTKTIQVRRTGSVKIQ